MTAPIVHLIAQLDDTGVATVVKHLACGMQQMGHPCEIWCYQQQPESSHVQGVPVRYIDIPGLSQLNGTKQRSVRKLLGRWRYQRHYAPQFSQHLDNALHQAQAQVCLVHGLNILPFARLRHRCVYVAHNTKSKMLLSRHFSWLHRWQKARWQSIYANKQLIAVSKGARADLIEHFQVHPDNIQAIYNPFPIDKIQQLAQHPIAEPLPDSYFIAMGRVVRQKRFDRLLRAYAQSHSQTPLLILTGGGRLKELHQQIQQLNLVDRVKVLGFRDNPYPYLKNAKALLLSSDFEGLPTVIIESLICQTPVVSTDCPNGPQEILTGDWARYLCPPENEQQLAQLIQQIDSHPYAVSSHAMEPFNAPHSVSAYLQAIDQLA